MAELVAAAEVASGVVAEAVAVRMGVNVEVEAASVVGMDLEGGGREPQASEVDEQGACASCASERLHEVEANTIATAVAVAVLQL